MFKKQRAAKITVRCFIMSPPHRNIPFPVLSNYHLLGCFFFLFRQSVVIYLVRFFINKVVFWIFFRQND
ncbi:hypothetical protein HMPREF3203_01213 [Proteus mirabilis]|nr:hypothetical protein HMPREF3203_01213 [Proteus mirabilis]